MSEYSDGDQRVDLVTAALRATGEAALPSDFDATLKTYDEMMAAIAAIPSNELDALADETDSADLGADALELGLAYIERGDFDRAERWMRCAQRHGAGDAHDRLADLDELRVAIADLRGIFLTPGRAGTVPEHDDITAVAEPLADPYAQARRIIDEAERRAASIVATAKMQAKYTRPQQPPPDRRADLVVPGRSPDETAVGVVWSQSSLAQALDVAWSAPPRKIVLAYSTGTGKTTQAQAALLDVIPVFGTTSVIIVDNCFSSADAGFRPTYQARVLTRHRLEARPNCKVRSDDFVLDELIRAYAGLDPGFASHDVEALFRRDPHTTARVRMLAEGAVDHRFLRWFAMRLAEVPTAAQTADRTRPEPGDNRLLIPQAAHLGDRIVVPA